MDKTLEKDKKFKKETLEIEFLNLFLFSQITGRATSFLGLPENSYHQKSYTKETVKAILFGFCITDGSQIISNPSFIETIELTFNFLALSKRFFPIVWKSPIFLFKIVEMLSLLRWLFCSSRNSIQAKNNQCWRFLSFCLNKKFSDDCNYLCSVPNLPVTLFRTSIKTSRRLTWSSF